MKKTIILLLAIVFLLTACVSATAPNLKMLQEKIGNAPSNSVIDINTTYRCCIGDNNGGVLINKDNITIDGHNSIIDGSCMSRIFKVTGNNVIIKNFIIMNANVKNNDGGAILNTGANLKLQKISFVGNDAHYGGAIQNNGLNCTLEDCDFNSNRASSCGGAINNNADKLTINNTKFYENKAGYGGGVCNDGNHLTVGNSSFTNNNGNQKGGAINNNHATLVDVSNTTFTNNHANKYGGAIHEDKGTELTVNNTIFNINKADDEAGSVYLWKSSNTTVTNSSFVGNSANNGGAIRNYNSPDLNVVESNFINNKANNGAGIYNSGNDTQTIDSGFINNSGNDGGAVYNVGHCYYMESNRFTGNHIEVGSLKQANGAAVYNDGCMEIRDSEFVQNTAKSSGFLSTALGGAIYNKGKVITYTSTYDSNKAENGYGGAIYDDEGLTGAIFCSFVDNQARYGKAFYVEDSSGLAANCWWGTNTPNWNQLVSKNVDHDNYSVLNFTVTDNRIQVNTVINNSDSHTYITRPVSITIGADKLDGNLFYGQCRVKYTPPAGKYVIKVNVDHQELNKSLP